MTEEYKSKAQIVRDKIERSYERAEERVEHYRAMREELSRYGEWTLGYYSGMAEAYSNSAYLMDTLLSTADEREINFRRLNDNCDRKRL